MYFKKRKTPLKCLLGVFSSLELLLKIEFLNESVVTFLVVVLKVLEVCATVSNHLKEAAARVLVLQVLLEVKRKLVDALREDSNLNSRGTSVRVVKGYFLNNFLLFSLCQHVAYGSTPVCITQVPHPT